MRRSGVRSSPQSEHQSCPSPSSCPRTAWMPFSLWYSIAFSALSTSSATCNFLQSVFAEPMPACVENFFLGRWLGHDDDSPLAVMELEVPFGLLHAISACSTACSSCPEYLTHALGLCPSRSMYCADAGSNQSAMSSSTPVSLCLLTIIFTSE